MATSGGAVQTPPSGPQPSKIQTSPNVVGFDPRLVVPQQPIYLQRNDQLTLNVISNTLNAILRFNYRWLNPEGEIKEGEFTTPPIGTITSFAIPLYEGWLISFAARVTSTEFVGQWNFLQVFLSRNQAPIQGVPVHAVIWQGFITNGTNNGWPGTPSKEITDGPGTIRSITGTTPGAGNEIFETVPSGRRWTLLGFRTTFTTSATVANRFPRFQLDDGANNLLIVGTNAAQTAGVLSAYHLVPGSQFYTDTQTDFIIPAPVLVQLKSGFHIKTATIGIQAGDTYTFPQYSVLEWGLWDA